MTDRNDIKASITVEVGERRGSYALRVRMLKKFHGVLKRIDEGTRLLNLARLTLTLTVTHQEKDTGPGGRIAVSNSGDYDIEVTIAVHVRHRRGVMVCYWDQD